MCEIDVHVSRKYIFPSELKIYTRKLSSIVTVVEMTHKSKVKISI